jgi:hypothetical protein|eukprot:g164.t1
MKRKRTSYARGSGRVEGIPNDRKYRLCYIEKTLDRTYLTVDAVMKKELLECRNKTGRLNLTSRSRLVKLDHLSQQKFQNVLRLDELERRRQVKRQKIEADIERERLKKEAFNQRRDERTGRVRGASKGLGPEFQYGCSKCRWALKGCGRCRAPDFKLGKKEGTMAREGMTIARPGASDASLAMVGKIQHDMGGVKVDVAISTNTPICKRVAKATKGKVRGYGVICKQEVIKKGSPVLEYVGELLNHEQAEAREAFYASAGILCCYQLSLSLDPGADILDSTLYGNAGRFINSSCSPNLVCKKLMGESPHEGVPSSNAYASPARPMFYASRDILKGDELTWQYNAPPPKSARSSSEEAAGLVQQRNGSHMDTEKASCYCGEKNCVGRL